jgi:SAM-dependent methyltransferase
VTSRWERIARSTAGDDYAAQYAKRFREMAESGQDVHGEATFLAGMVPPPATVLDAGCGTGRIAVRLHEIGYDVVGVDVDPEMLFVAAAEAPDLHWLLADLTTLELETEFDVVLVAGNTIPLLEEGTLAAACVRLAAHTVPGGLVVCGFGLDAEHLPTGCPVTPAEDFLAAMSAAGLIEVGRFGTWQGEAFDPADGYLVSVHRSPLE